MMKKIVIYNIAPAIGGHEILSLHFIDMLLQSGEYDISAIISNSNFRFIGAIKEKGIAVYPINGTTSRLHFATRRFERSIFKRLKILLEEIRPDYVIALQGNIEISDEIIGPAHKLGIPVITYIPLTYHLKDVSRHRIIGHIKDVFDKKIFKSVDRFITINDEMKGYISDRGKSAKDIYVVENGVDFSVFDDCNRTSVKQKYGIADDRRVYSIIGRIEFSHKGQDVVLEMLNKYRNDFSDSVFIIAGDGQDKKKLDERIKEYKLGDIVKAVGHVATPGELYAITDTLIVPSWFEGGVGTPLVIYEAQYYGCVVCGNDISGMKEQLGVDFIFDNRDILSLRNCLLRAKSVCPYVQTTKEVLCSTHSIDIFKNKFINILRQIENGFCIKNR